MTIDEMEPFVDQYDALIRSFCRRLSRYREDIDDLYQATFLKAIASEKPDSMSPADERNWLITICINQYRDTLRYSKRHAVIPMINPSDPDAVFDITDSRIGALDVFITHEEQQELWLELNKLDDKYRIPIVLFYFLDQSTGDVARILKLPQSTILSRLHRARKILARKLR